MLSADFVVATSSPVSGKRLASSPAKNSPPPFSTTLPSRSPLVVSSPPLSMIGDGKVSTTGEDEAAVVRNSPLASSRLGWAGGWPRPSFPFTAIAKAPTPGPLVAAAVAALAPSLTFAAAPLLSSVSRRTPSFGFLPSSASWGTRSRVCGRFVRAAVVPSPSSLPLSGVTEPAIAGEMVLLSSCSTPTEMTSSDVVERWQRHEHSNQH